MLLPISIKNILCVRAACSVVIERVIYESIDTTSVNELSNYTNPTDILYFISSIYFIQMYLFEKSPEYEKQTRLRELVLSPEMHRSIHITLFFLFFLIKNPLNAI